MMTCEFVTELKFNSNRIKRSSLFLFLLLYAVMKFSAFLYARRSQRKKPEIYKDNKQELKLINSWKQCRLRSVAPVGYSEVPEIK